MASAPKLVQSERHPARLVEYVRPVRIRGVGGPTGSHAASETMSVEYDSHFVYATELGKGSVIVPMSNVVRIELP